MDLLRFGPQLPQYNWPNDRANTATTAAAGSAMGVIAEITRAKLQNPDSRNAAAAGFAGGLVGLAAELGLQKRRQRRIQQRPDPRPPVPRPAPKGRQDRASTRAHDPRGPPVWSSGVMDPHYPGRSRSSRASPDAQAEVYPRFRGERGE